MGREQVLDFLLDLDEWPRQVCDTLSPPGWVWVESANGVFITEIAVSHLPIGNNITESDWKDAKLWRQRERNHLAASQAPVNSGGANRQKAASGTPEYHQGWIDGWFAAKGG